MAAQSLVVDVHSHLYSPTYVSLLRSRTTVPYINSRVDGDRLIILENEPRYVLLLWRIPSLDAQFFSEGRPVGPQYWERDQKLAFMDKHGIDISVVSGNSDICLRAVYDQLEGIYRESMAGLPIAK